MTDAHCHIAGDETRHFFCAEPDAPLPALKPGDRLFLGLHPWRALGTDVASLEAPLALLASKLHADPTLGVGEIGLDRLRERNISDTMRALFRRQLALAAELHRPVTLHGAKCWGEVVKECEAFAEDIPAFIFHGFSRSPGLFPAIFALNGFISIGPAILNDHAVNYRTLAKSVPADRLLVESDRTDETAADAPRLSAIVEKLAELRSITADELADTLERNAISTTRGYAQAPA